MKYNIEEIARKFNSYGWHLIEANLSLRRFITIGDNKINRLVMNIFKDSKNHSDTCARNIIHAWNHQRIISAFGLRKT